MSLKNSNPKLFSKIRKIAEEISHETTAERGIEILYNLATRDPKTGVHNYRFFESVIKIEIGEAKRGKKICLAMIDLDYFKKINEKHGHIKADKILKKVATEIEKIIRTTDVMARFGGEEFIICLSNTALKNSFEVCEKIRKRIEGIWRGEITISIGVTNFKKSDSRFSFENRVARALKEAKHEGRNRTVSL